MGFVARVSSRPRWGRPLPRDLLPQSVGSPFFLLPSPSPFAHSLLSPAPPEAPTRISTQSHPLDQNDRTTSPWRVVLLSRSSTLSTPSTLTGARDQTEQLRWMEAAHQVPQELRRLAQRPRGRRRNPSLVRAPPRQNLPRRADALCRRVG